MGPAPLGDEWDDWIQFGAGVAIVVGLILSFLPQHYECHKAKSAFGLSSHMLLFGSVTLIFQLLTNLLEDLPKFHSCPSETFVACGIDMQATAQNISCAIFGYPSWYLWYFMYEGRSDNLGKLLACGLVVFVLLAVFLSILAASTSAINVDRLSTAWGVVGTTSNIVMWWPQIYTTVTLKNKGTLSLWTLAISALGDWIVVASLLWADENFWVVLPYFPDSGLQIVLIFLGLDYQRQRRKAAALLADKSAQETLLANPVAVSVGVPPVPD